MRIHPAGERAFLVVDDGFTAGKLRAVARALDAAGMISVVGHSSVLVFKNGRDFDGVAILQLADSAKESSDAPSQLHRMDVRFGGEHGPDLPLLLDHAQLDEETFLDRIAHLELTARYLGFRPGFAYLDGWPLEWQLPRRAESRVSVPTGSFAIAGSMAAFYPSSSPGGWNLLGRTATSFWNPLIAQPNLIAPGDRIRITPVPELPVSVKVAEPSLELTDVICRIESPGIASYAVDAEDLTRCTLGLPAGGAFDESLREQLGVLLDVSATTSALECTASGPRIRFLKAARLAWGGAAAEVRKNGQLIDTRRVLEVDADDLVEIGTLHGSLRGLLLFEDGVLDPQKPKCSMTRRLQRGDLLASQPISVHTGGRPRAGHRNVRPHGSDPYALDVIIGPHETDRGALEKFFQATWTVSPASDRTGIRLRSEKIDHRPAADLPSCGAQCGTIQWHPNGEIVILGPDHPITGGYHQVATLRQSERWKLARLMPGESVKFIAT